MVHYLLFGRQIVNNQSKDQWDSQEKNKKTALIPQGNKGSFKKHDRLEEN